MTYEKYIGIDPGLNGGIAILHENLMLDLYIMPIIKGKHKEYDIHKLTEVLTSVGTTSVFCTIEKQQAMPKQGVSSTFKTGYGFGVLEGVVNTLNIPYQIITAKEWQKKILVGVNKDKNTKQASALVSQRLYPHIDFRKTRRCKNLHDGLTDATCIMEYGRRLWNKN